MLLYTYKLYNNGKRKKNNLAPFIIKYGLLEKVVYQMYVIACINYTFGHVKIFILHNLDERKSLSGMMEDITDSTSDQNKGTLSIKQMQL